MVGSIRNMSQRKPLKILVIGPTGHGGSYLCLELCGRGHQVYGLSRNPGTIGEHPNYHPIVFDIVNSSFTELHKTMDGYDVVVKYIRYTFVLSTSEFSPHSEGHAALVYSTNILSDLLT